MNTSLSQADKQTCSFKGRGGSMNINRFQNSSPGLRRVAIKLLQAVALALVVTLAMPAAVAEDRAVRSRVAPIYPEIAKRMRASGTVSIEATVDPSGNVSDAKATGGNRLLAPAAEDAVRKWKFESGPATTKVTVEVNFALAQ